MFALSTGFGNLEAANAEDRRPTKYLERGYNPNNLETPHGVVNLEQPNVPTQPQHYQIHAFNKKPAASKPLWKTVNDYFTQPMPEHWFNGTMNEEFPAMAKQGMFELEPYFIGSAPLAQINNNGQWQKGSSGSPNSFTNSWFFEYGITDRLSFEITPSYNVNWGNQTGKGSYTSFNDLPVELLYNVFSTNNPSLTLYLGFQAPTGNYQNESSTDAGSGWGTWFFNFGLQSQWAFLISKHHVLNVAFWGIASQSTGNVSIKGTSATYGTDSGFNGTGSASQFGSEGIGLEYSLWSRKATLACDLYESWVAPIRTTGQEANGSYVNATSRWSQDFTVEPEFEYSFTEHLGLLVGLEITAAGRNTTASLSPEFALNAVY
ncbi:hypothetical protein FAI41_06105 [Acetobacteraceae bacterium]|nr:hypothetical protein FAI41_06105 [Acetobacteraceae bacterium]